MYFNIKSKYKKIIWLLIGFILSCIYVHKVSAYNYRGFEFDNDTLTTLFHQAFDGKSYHDISSNISNNNLIDINNYSYVYIKGYTTNENVSKRQIYFFDNISSPFFYNGNTYMLYKNQTLPVLTMIVEDNYTISTKMALNSDVQIYLNEWTNSSINFKYYPGATNFDVIKNGNIILQKFFDYSPNPLPDYLSGYTEITLEPGERYVIFSSSTITSGSVFIPIEDFNNYGSRISYFDKDIDTQPYTSYIQDFSTTPDGLYARQNFNLSSYNGADFIMFSKYIYLEGQDNITSSVWVPSEMYSSIVEITPNNTGGNDFDFSYVDENGELQADIISSSDLSQPSPLISDLFTNFTTKDYGLSSIITAPIPLLQSLNNATCTNIELPIGSFGGVHDRRIILPCMNTFYHDTFGELYTLYQTIAAGLIAYFVGLAYFNKIKQLKDPYNDKIEVVNL